MDYEAVNLASQFAALDALWSPRVVAQLNDCEFKLARIAGDFVWHRHDDTDEAFLVVAGELRIDFRDGSVTLREGELYVVPRGVEHRPHAERECHILMVERAGTARTGTPTGAGETEPGAA